MTTCNATDALLRVEYNVTQDAWDSSRSPFPEDEFNFRPFIQLEGDVIKGDRVVRYDSFADLIGYEACLPKDECSEIVVGGLPTDGYKVSFDGKAVEIGHEFFFDGVNPATSTNVGICPMPPVCNDGEALLEIHFWQGYLYNDDYVFRVEDKDSNVVLDGTTESQYQYATTMTLNKTYACIPRDDACYTFLIGGSDQYDIAYYPASSYAVIYDGELVRSSDSWLFDSVQFGDSCELPCNPKDESHFEFFMYDAYGPDYDENYQYEWSLSSPSATLDSGVVPQGPGISQLAYMSKCIPKDSCVSFNIVAPLNATKTYSDGSERTLNPHPTYSLTMDNVTYRKLKREWDDSNINQTTIMGSCTVADLCDEETQDLFHLELHTPATNDYTVPPFPTVSRPIEWNWIFWSFGRDDVHLLQSTNYNNIGYDIDTKYGVIECVPKDGCELSFEMELLVSSSIVESYTVKKNDIQLNDAQEYEDDRPGYIPYRLEMPFGENCFTQPSSSLPGIGIARIVIACVVAHTLLCLV